MSRFVVILAFALLALTFAKPATNYGNSNSTGSGDSKIGVVDNSTFGNDAFGSGSQPQPQPQQPQQQKRPCGFIGSVLNPLLPIC